MVLPLRMSPEDEAKFRADFDARMKELAYELTPGQQLALFTLRRSDLCREIVDMLKRSTVRATEADFDNLIRRGYAQHHHSGKRIVTYVGKLRCDTLAKQAARELGLHFFTVGSDRLHQKLFCTCGWSHHYSASWSHVARCNAEWMGKHLRDVNTVKATVVADNDGWTDWPAAEDIEPKEVPFQ